MWVITLGEAKSFEIFDWCYYKDIKDLVNNDDDTDIEIDFPDGWRWCEGYGNPDKIRIDEIKIRLSGKWYDIKRPNPYYNLNSVFGKWCFLHT